MRDGINKFLTVREFAEKLRIHVNTVYNAIKGGRIQATKCSAAPNSHYRIPDTELNRLCELDMTKTIDKLVEEKSNEKLNKMDI